MDRLRVWLERYLDLLQETVAAPDLQRFPLFYYPCQALFYIFCFRHRQLLAMHGARLAAHPRGRRCKGRASRLTALDRSACQMASSTCTASTFPGWSTAPSIRCKCVRAPLTA
jgi:hypothetical protein